ncbi:MAG: VWA domain-containing protein [Chloroflexota bacterium]
MNELGYGSQRSSNLRKLDIGDDYALTNVEKTLLNSLSRPTPTGQGLSLKVEDFEIHELVHQTRMTSGIIIDESGSMQGDKLHAAVEASLALTQLIRKEPKDGLKVILFADHVKEVSYWDILNTTFSGGTTDIRAALRSFRRMVRSSPGDKQVYLITDTEPNTQEGRYVGFDIAAAGVLEEAWRYRQEGITLNIIMLSQSPNLKALSSQLGQRSLGRVFFTSPQNLGGMVIEDYLKTKKRVL